MPTVARRTGPDGRWEPLDTSSVSSSFAHDFETERSACAHTSNDRNRIAWKNADDRGGSS